MVEKKRRTPNSLISVLQEVLEVYFQGNKSKAGRILNENLNNERHRLNIDANTLRRMLKNSQDIKYGHFEAFANYLHVPSGVILLLSRFKSLRRDGKEEELIQLLNATIKFCESARNTGDLSLDKMVSIFRLEHTRNDAPLDEQKNLDFDSNR